MPGYVYRVKVIINLYIWYILNEGLEFHVQCMICFILMRKKGYIIMCKLVQLAFCLCCEPIDSSNIGFAVVFAGIGIRLSLHFKTVFYCLLDSAVYHKKG